MIGKCSSTRSFREKTLTTVKGWIHGRLFGCHHFGEAIVLAQEAGVVGSGLLCNLRPIIAGG